VCLFLPARSEADHLNSDTLTKAHNLCGAPDENQKEVSMTEMDMSALSARASRAAAKCRRWQRFSLRPTVATAGKGVGARGDGRTPT